jgi:hypothetical protein
MNGVKHEIDVNELQVSSVTSDVEGGFLYSTTSTKQLKVTIKKSNFLGVYAKT